MKALAVIALIVTLVGLTAYFVDSQSIPTLPRHHIVSSQPVKEAPPRIVIEKIVIREKIIEKPVIVEKEVVKEVVIEKPVEPARVEVRYVPEPPHPAPVYNAPPQPVYYAPVAYPPPPPVYYARPPFPPPACRPQAVNWAPRPMYFNRGFNPQMRIYHHWR
jgi:hypothetical protein